MNFQRRQRSKPVKYAPTVGGSCPNAQCSICGNLLILGQRLALEFARIGKSMDFPVSHEFELTHEFDSSVSIVRSGVAMLHRTLEDGRRQVFDFRFPGEPLALKGLLPKGIMVTTLTPLTICQFKGDELDRFFKQYPHAEKSLQEAARRLMGDELNHAVLLGCYDASERVAAFLLDCGDRLIGSELTKGIVNLPMNRNQMADYLGMNPETVSRQISRLKKDGLIEMPSPASINILDRENLRRRVPEKASANV